VFDDANPANIKVDASVQTASVNTGNEKRDGHLKTADFFDAEKNPTISFKSTKVAAAGKNKYKVTGDFTMHGVTKSVTFDAEFLGAARSVSVVSRGARRPASSPARRSTARTSASCGTRRSTTVASCSATT
jgi:polyisoprenoid-binding protein YceI